MDGIELCKMIIGWIEGVETGLLNKICDSDINPVNKKFFKPSKEVEEQDKRIAKYYKINADMYEEALRNKGVEISL